MDVINYVELPIRKEFNLSYMEGLITIIPERKKEFKGQSVNVVNFFLKETMVSLFGKKLLTLGNNIEVRVGSSIE